MMTSNLILVGPMGTGKSTVGAALARELSRPHVDTDQFFTLRYGPIPQYFADHGEPAFRSLEERIVEELLDAPRPSVISLGGGSVQSEKTRELLKKHYVVLLDMTAEQASQRIPDASSRPMLSRPARKDTAAAGMIPTPAQLGRGDTRAPAKQNSDHYSPHHLSPGEASPQQLSPSEAHRQAMAQWERIYWQRQPLYRACADYVIDAGVPGIQERVEQIMHALKKGKQQR